MDAMIMRLIKYFIEHKPPPLFWALALAGAVLATSATIVTDFDFWWHLKTGEIIWKWRQIPDFDIFSYTAAGAPWMNHEWLFQIVAWLLYDHLGLVSFTALKLALAALIALAAFRTFDLLTENKNTALWGTLIMVWIMAERISERPHLFSMLFLAYFALRLHGFVAGKTKHLWEMPLIQIIWINMHGGGLLGPQIILAFAAGETIQKAFDTPHNISRDKIHHLWIIGLAATAAMTINPSGIAIFFNSFDQLKLKFIMEHTQEWLPVLDPRIDPVIPQLLFRIILVGTFVSFIINRRLARLSHLFVCALSGFLVLKGRRFVAENIIISLPIFFYNLKTVAGRIPVSPGGMQWRAWVNILLVAMISNLAITQGVPMTFSGSKLIPFGSGVWVRFTPSGTVNFLDEQNIHGRVFNEMGMGGYLIFGRWPGELVFIDGRTPVFGDDFYHDFVDAFRVARNFEELHERYKFDYIVLRSSSAWDLRFFHKYLWESGKWKLVFADAADGLVYLHNEPKFKDVIAKFELEKHPLLEEMNRNPGPDPLPTTSFLPGE